MATRPTLDLVQSVSVLDNRIKTLESIAPTSGGIVLNDGTKLSYDEVSAVNNGTILVYVSDDPPTGLNSSTNVGALWYDSDNNNAKHWWDGFVWLPWNVNSPFFLGSTSLASLGPATISRSLNSIRIYSQSTAPSAPAHGWLWRDTASANAYKRWNGSTWQSGVVDSNTAAAAEAAIAAANMSDNYLVVFYQDTPPASQGTTTGVGNMWFDTNNNYTQYTWDGGQWLASGQSEEPEGPALTDGLPPSSSPTPELQPGIGFLFIKWDEIENNDPVWYNIYVSTNSSVPVDTNTYAGTVSGTFAMLRTLPNGTAFAENVNYYARIIARDADGPGPSSPVGGPSTVIAKITSTEISDGAVKTPQLFANAVTSLIVASDAVYTNAIQFGAATGTKLSATAVDGKTITGSIVQTAAGGERIVIRNDGSGGVIESFSGVVGETPGGLDPSVYLGVPALTLKPGTSPGNTFQSFLRMYSGPSMGQISMTGSFSVQGGPITLSGSSTVWLQAGGTSMVEVSTGGVVLGDNTNGAVSFRGDLSFSGATVVSDLYMNGRNIMDCSALNVTSLTTRGASMTIGMGTGGVINMGGGTLNMGGNGTINSVSSINNGGNDITFSAHLKPQRITATQPRADLTGVPNVRYVSNANGGEICYTSHANSSIDIKKNVQNLEEEVEPWQVYELEPVSYEKKVCPSDRPEGYRFWGFILEQLRDLGFGPLIDIDEDGEHENDVLDYMKICVVQQIAIRDLHRRLLAGGL